MKRVLIVGGQHRKALITTRLLGKSGYFIGVTGDSRFTTSFFSKFCNKRYIIPNHKERPQAYLKRIIKIIKDDRYDLIFPMEDEEIRLLSKERKKLKPAKFPFIEDSILQKVFDKAYVLKLAKRIGVSIPKTYFVTNLSQLPNIVKKIAGQWVIKPRTSFGAIGLAYGENQKDLTDKYKKIHQQFPYPIIQEKIIGNDVGTGFLYGENQKNLAQFSYRRIRSYPIAGGASTLRESWFDEKLLKQGRKLLDVLKWYGVASIEFRKDIRDGSYKLLEINPRLWACQALAVYSGVPFPLLLTKLTFNENIKPIKKFPSGKIGRWLVGDILHFLTNHERFKLNPSFFDFFSPNSEVDEWDKDDIEGFIGTFICIFWHAVNPKNWKYLKRGQTNEIKKYSKLLTLGIMGFLPFPAFFSSVYGMSLSVILKILLPVNLLIIIWTVFAIVVLILLSQQIKNSLVEDTHKIVIDELISSFLLGFFVTNIMSFLFLLFIFRGLDIFKPFPINILQYKYRGGSAILLDDLAAVISTIILALLFRVV